MYLLFCKITKQKDNEEMQMKKRLFMMAMVCTMVFGIVACGEVDYDEEPKRKTEKVEEANDGAEVDNTMSVTNDIAKSQEEEHTHTWVDATCSTPKTCSGCGATEGSIIDHDVDTNTGRCNICDNVVWTILNEYNYEDYLAYEVVYEELINSFTVRLKSKNASTRYVDESQIVLTFSLEYKNASNQTRINQWSLSLDKGAVTICGDDYSLTFTGNFEFSLEVFLGI